MCFKLPCNIGDTVYELTEKKRGGSWHKVIVPRKVISITIERIMVMLNFERGGSIPADSDMIFYDQKSATEALSSINES